ncbi:ABC transporter permease [Marasmitruncus massiliensis]|uniref:ABC transporter permease n=1 Tax=Marasmitruncus massiliensis TaxID=1944642 RepID=UPI000C7B0AC6|nr:ABC transporter permease [Marasmitruncus massiliensis]
MKKKKTPEVWICGIVSVFAFLLLWQIGCSVSELGKMIPGPITVTGAVLKSMVSRSIGGHTLWIHIGYSLLRVLTGYILGSALGVVVGLAMGWNRVVEAFITPIFRLIRPIPPIAWIPISILWFGLGFQAKVFLIVLASFCNVTLNAWAGAKSVDPQLIGAAKMLGASKSQIFFTIVMPASVPQIFAGLQVAMSSSWTTVLAAEMVRSTEGLGWMIVTGQTNLDMTQILVGIVAIGVVGFILVAVMRRMEDILCRWNKGKR